MHFINIVYILYFPKIIYFDFSYKVNIYSDKNIKKTITSICNILFEL